jgi:hypothetical protein
VWRDVGATALSFRILTKVIDYNLMAFATAVFGRMMPDFKRHIGQDGRAGMSKAAGIAGIAASRKKK